MDAPTHVVRLELWLDGSSPSGHAIARDEAPRPFAGWLGLVSAVEALVTADSDRGPDSDTAAGSRTESPDDDTIT